MKFIRKITHFLFINCNTKKMGARTADATAVQSLKKSADSIFDFGRVM